MCRYFTELWLRTQRPGHELRRLHCPGGGSAECNPPSEFVRLKAFEKARPPVSSRWKCKCGCEDAFRCWSRTHSKFLLGEGRAARGCGWLLSM